MLLLPAMCPVLWERAFESAVPSTRQWMMTFFSRAVVAAWYYRWCCCGWRMRLR